MPHSFIIQITLPKVLKKNESVDDDPLRLFVKGEAYIFDFTVVKISHTHIIYTYRYLVKKGIFDPCSLEMLLKL